MNSRPSTPLCQNCCKTELYCQAVREYDRMACCEVCEHVRLGPVDPRT